ncbi:MAG TPA: response regulator transcription factor [Bacteroidales bacterium]|nr:response regulator transcription factor [Bacteroidales bacterium]
MMGARLRIFMVEDDKNFGAVMKSYLSLHDYEVEWVDDGAMAIETFRKYNFDLCILDVMLPHVDGFTIAAEIRKINERIPFIFLTAKTLKKDILEGFRLGADDYITKPFDSEVLLMKIKAILKRNSFFDPEIVDEYKIGQYAFNPSLRTITLGNAEQKLSPKESELLRMLCSHMNRVLPREQALISIWGEDNYFTTRSMDVFVSKLRKYLKDDPDVEIGTVHGSGYILKASK